MSLPHSVSFLSLCSFLCSIDSYSLAMHTLTANIFFLFSPSLLSSQHPRRLIKALNSSFLPFIFLSLYLSFFSILSFPLFSSVFPSFLVLTILSLIHSCLVSFSISFPLSLSLSFLYCHRKREKALFLHLIKI